MGLAVGFEQGAHCGCEGNRGRTDVRSPRKETTEFCHAKALGTELFFQLTRKLKKRWEVWGLNGLRIYSIDAGVMRALQNREFADELGACLVAPGTFIPELVG